MSKQFALNQIRHKKNAFTYMCAGIYLLNSEAIKLLDGAIVIFNKQGIIFNPDVNDRINGRVEIDLGQILTARNCNKSDFDVDTEEIYKFVRRNLLKESYEVAHEYARKSGNITKFKAEPWYWYARIIRNTVSHGLQYEFKAPDTVHGDRKENGNNEQR